MSTGEEQARLNQVIESAAPGGRLLSSRPLAGGISAHMILLEFREAGGNQGRLVLRRHGDHHLRGNPRATADEFRLLQAIQPLGLAAPLPLHLDQSGRIFPAPYMLLEYIEGDMHFSPSNLEAYIAQLAGRLARIHTVDLASVDLNFLRQAPAVCAEALTQGPLDASLLPAERRVRASLAAKRTGPPGNRPALLHGDFWPGNTVWRGEALAAVIDWEDAAIGDPLIDLARSRSELAWIFGIDAMRAFTRRYLSMAPFDMTDLPYWDLCAARRIIRLAGSDLDGLVAYFARYGRPDLTPHAITAGIGRFIDQAIAARSA